MLLLIPNQANLFLIFQRQSIKPSLVASSSCLSSSRLFYGKKIAIAVMGENFISISSRHPFFHRPANIAAPKQCAVVGIHTVHEYTCR
jgi:hypothetical protein